MDLGRKLQDAARPSALGLAMICRARNEAVGFGKAFANAVHGDPASKLLLRGWKARSMPGCLRGESCA